MDFEDKLEKYLEESEENLKQLDKRAIGKVGKRKVKLDRSVR